MKINKLENKVLATIRKYNMFSEGDRVLVGLSGGKDSVVLLTVLMRLSPILKIDLVSFHLNHGIRGEEANSDESFSKSISEKYGIRFISRFANVPEISSQSFDSLEVVARNERYKWFDKIAQKENCNKVATAHTASDNTETFFITLLRSGNSRYIPPIRGNIVRPLIEVTTEEILNYSKETGLEFVTDSTNADDSYTRNYIRNRIIPLFKLKSPSFDESIGKNSDILRSYEALCEREAERILTSKDCLTLKKLLTLCNDLAYHNVLYTVLNKKAIELNVSLTYSKFIETKALISSGRTGQKVDLSDSVSIYRSYDCIEFRSDSAFDAPYEFTIQMGRNDIPDSNLVLYLESPEEYDERMANNEQTDKKINKLTKNILFKYNIINSSLVARSRKKGDEYFSEGMNRSVKKHMINEKIPSSIRSKIPIVCDKKGIIWVPGLRVADRVKNEEGDLLSLSISFEN